MHSTGTGQPVETQDVFFWRLAGRSAPTGLAFVHWIGCINAIKRSIFFNLCRDLCRDRLIMPMVKKQINFEKNKTLFKPIKILQLILTLCSQLYKLCCTVTFISSDTKVTMRHVQMKKNDLQAAIFWCLTLEDIHCKICTNLI